MSGILYLIPSPLGENDPKEVIPAGVLELLPGGEKSLMVLKKRNVVPLKRVRVQSGITQGLVCLSAH